MQDYYDLFDLEFGSSSEDIIKILRQKIRNERKKNDLSPEGSEAAKESQKNLFLLEEAMKIFKDASKRKAYDEKLSEYRKQNTSSPTKAQKTVLKEDESFEAVINDLDIMIFRENRADEACQYIMEAIREGRMDPRLFYLWAYGCVLSLEKESESDQYYGQKRAIEVIKQGLLVYPANIKLLLLAARFYVYSNEYLSALPYVRKALAIAPTHGEAIGWDIAIEFLTGNDLSATRRLNRYKDVFKHNYAFQDAIYKGFRQRINLCFERNADGYEFITCQEDYDQISDMVEYFNKTFPDLLTEKYIQYYRGLGERSWKVFSEYRTDATGILYINLGLLVICTLFGAFPLGVLLFSVWGIPLTFLILMNMKPRWQLEYEDITARGDIWKHLLVGWTSAKILRPAAKGLYLYLKWSLKATIAIVRFLCKPW